MDNGAECVGATTMVYGGADADKAWLGDVYTFLKRTTEKEEETEVVKSEYGLRRERLGIKIEIKGQQGTRLRKGFCWST